MPSPTGVTKLVRKKKKANQGRRRKRESRQVGTVNFFKAFAVPTVDDFKKQAAK